MFEIQSSTAIILLFLLEIYIIALYSLYLIPIHYPSYATEFNTKFLPYINTNICISYCLLFSFFFDVFGDTINEYIHYRIFIKKIHIRYAISKRTYKGGTYKHCSICLEDLKEGEIITKLKCNHEFHDNCISIWLNPIKDINTCPLCRHCIY